MTEHQQSRVKQPGKSIGTPQAICLILVAIICLSALGFVTYRDRQEIDASKYRELNQAARHYPAIKPLVQGLMKSTGQITNRQYEKVFVPALDKAKQQAGNKERK